MEISSCEDVMSCTLMLLEAVLRITTEAELSLKRVPYLHGNLLRQLCPRRHANMEMQSSVSIGLCRRASCGLEHEPNTANVVTFLDLAV